MQRQILKQMQKMQEKMQSSLAQVQQELENATVTGEAGGGAVVVTVTGHQEVRSVKIKPEVVDPADVEMLEDLVLVAMREALEKSKALSMEKMNRVASGLNLPPGLF
ncbi:MAG TPA: YbaB/EbfC family nucleoid-associated protein [Candidatus Nitrosotenuis sp.]|jgi:DNA-binding YbaB/EbfC family protein|nr:YbaB/EbfC family nucleoid-associated protein [Candidatus Nitrosotenuis sp.]